MKMKSHEPETAEEEKTDDVEWLEIHPTFEFDPKQLRYRWFRLCENYVNEGFEHLRITPEAREAYNQMTDLEREYILKTFPEHKHILERTMTKEMWLDVFDHFLPKEQSEGENETE